jgi:glycosyltransferase involved in cell wall biosynthesis
MYARLLRERGHDVLVISQPAPRPDLKQRLKSLLSSGRLMPYPPAAPFLDGVRHKVLERPRPVADSDLPDADVVVATWWETAFWVAALSPEKGRKIYFVQHHEVHQHQPWQISRGSYYLPLKKIAVSQWLADVMARDYGDADVVLVRNSVDLRQFHAPRRDRQLVPTVGLMYSPLHYKGVDLSLCAIEKARQRLPDLKIVAFGAHAPVPQLPLPRGCTYCRNPGQDELRSIYSGCDVWLFGSRKEGFGLPLLEAMACRTPVVAARAGAAPDLIRDGVNGYVVDTDDSDALADRLVGILALPQDDWQAMSDAAFATAKVYSWNGATDLFEKAIADTSPACETNLLS